VFLISTFKDIQLQRELALSSQVLVFLRLARARIKEGQQLMLAP
jgi:hypothetical protein